MTEPVAKRRRRLRYSMRTLLVLVTVLCIWLGFVVSRAQRQRRIVEKLHECSGRVIVRYDYQHDRGVEPRGPQWLRRLLGDDYFHDVVFLDFFAYHTDDITPDDLANLSGLRELALRQMPITDDGLRKLARLRKLESLTIHSRDVTDQGLKYLSGLTELKKLTISTSQFTDRGLEHLSSLTKLTHLTLSSNQITGVRLGALAALMNLSSLSLPLGRTPLREIEVLAQLTNLDTLSISSNEVTDEGLKALAKLRSLTKLTIRETKYRGDAPSFTDEGLKQIARLSNLWRLTFIVHGITDTGLAQLAPLSQLRHLDIADSLSMYTEEGVAALQAQLPELTVEYNVRNSVTGQTNRRSLTPTPNNPRKAR